MMEDLFVFLLLATPLVGFLGIVAVLAWWLSDPLARVRRQHARRGRRTL